MDPGKILGRRGDTDAVEPDSPEARFVLLE
jgi:hypothetical protein